MTVKKSETLEGCRAKSNEDLTGRNRIILNVLSSWGGYIVIMISGIALPRIIDMRLGQTSLGIWDFSWSIVNYMNFASLGVGSSVNRYIALYRASRDIGGLRIIVSSVLCLQFISALLVLFITSVLIWILPAFLSDSPLSEIAVAQQVLFYLGLSMAFQLCFNTSKGILSGCHRWDLLNGIMTIFYVTSVATMVTTILFGGGLVSISVVYLCCVITAEVVRAVVAFRICPEIVIGFRYIRMRQAFEMLRFGGKTFITGLPHIILTQTTNIFITAFLGAPTLAVFARSMALIRHFQSFMTRFSFVLTPTAGSLFGGGKQSELRQFFLDTAFYGFSIALPITIFLSIYGDILLQLWMGPRYANGTLMAILAVGFCLPISQNSAMRILMGMNQHGKIGVFVLLLSLALFGLGLLTLNFMGWNLVMAAFVISIPLTVGDGIIVPVYTCRKLDIPLRSYLSKVFLTPLMCGILFGAVLILIRTLMKDNIIASLAAGAIGGGVVLGLLYWNVVIPLQYRRKLILFLSEKLKTMGRYFSKPAG